MSKVLKALAKAVLVVSHRGAHGGYQLAHRPEDVSVVRVIEALEGPIALTECGTPAGAPCGIEPTCLAKGSWDPISRAVHGALQKLPLSAIGPYRLAAAVRQAQPPHGPGLATPGAPAPALPVLPGAPLP